MLLKGILIMANENIRRFNQEKAKSDFIAKFYKLTPIDPENPVSLFKYMIELNVLLDDLFNTGFNEGYAKALDIEVNKN
jgi:hypothetical protein